MKIILDRRDMERVASVKRAIPTFEEVGIEHFQSHIFNAVRYADEVMYVDGERKKYLKLRYDSPQVQNVLLRFDSALKEFGEYQLRDKGLQEIMECGDIARTLAEMGNGGQAGRFLKQLKDSHRLGQELIEYR